MRFLSILGLLALSGPAFSQNLTENEAAVLPRIIDTICLDLVEDLNGCETAVLLTSEREPDTADLIIFSDRRATGEQQILALARSIAFNGPMFGMSPSLERAENGSLELREEQIGIGRSPWTQSLSIAYRDGAFLIAGRSYSTYDRAMGGGFACDVNFLTGDWTTSADRPDPESEQTIYEADASGQLAAQRLALADWTWTIELPEPCTAAVDEWWDAEPQ